jgi:small subunit ribosomal protein S21e
MQNERGEFVDPYLPRKCSATNRIIAAKDHASVQINLADLNEDGVKTGSSTTYALCGYVRQKGESDGWLTLLAERDGLLKPIFQ